jgi:GAF domain
MGKRARGFFDEADRLGGLVARMRLASLAQVTSTEAAAAADSSEVADRLQKAMPILQREFSAAPANTAPAGSSGGSTNGAGGTTLNNASSTPAANANLPGAIAPAPRGDESTNYLRTQLQAIADLISQRELLLGDVQSTMRRIAEAVSATLRVRRVSIWFLNGDKSGITCKDLFDGETGQHTANAELLAKDFAPYFDALTNERTIAAHDAHRDPRTACFSASYLAPLGINSMLDVPIWMGGSMLGVVCCEHVGPKRLWNRDEETFAYVLSNFVTLALERARDRGVTP